jgi:ketosteroid isomerase-like protein
MYQGIFVELSKVHIDKVVAEYLRAWAEQDPDLIPGIFTEDATYQEGGFAEPMLGVASIRSYWQKKVVESQDNITCRHLLTSVDQETGRVTVKWEAEFDDRDDGFRKRIMEVALLTFEDGRISSLEEYWTSQKIRPLDQQQLPG